MDRAETRRRAVAGAHLFWAGLNHLIWPAVCINCGESIGDGDESLCGECWEELLECTGANYCRRCGREVSPYGIVQGACGACLGRDFHFDGLARAGVYSASLQSMILGLKHGRTELDMVLGFLLRSALAGSGFESQVDLFVGVPLHWSRRLVRGYDQSGVLIRRLGVGRSKVSRDLVRIRRTRMQTAMASDAKRRANVAGAFAVRRGHRFGGRAICLVDDIKTTGATLNECARVLKDAGASKVYALVLAIARQNVT